MSGWDQRHDQQPEGPPRKLVMLTLAVAVFILAWYVWPWLT